MKNITKILASLSVMSLIVGCSQKNELQLKNESLTIEYGKTIPTEAKDYLKNKDDILSKVKVETNSKNEDGKAYPSVGEYTVTLTYDNQKKDVKVIVKDTVAPAIKDMKDSYEVGYGEKFDVKLLQKNVTDLGAVTLTIDDSKVDYKKAGSYKAVLLAKDESNNEVKKEISITVRAEKKTSSSTTSSHSSSSTKPSSSHAAKPSSKPSKPSSKPSKPSKPNKPSSKPSKPSKPDYYIGNSGKLFNSKEEARDWAEEQMRIDRYQTYEGYGIVSAGYGKYTVSFKYYK